MRKNAPRKWLHAILDLLPVIMIPVFMIYSHRHDIDTYTLNVSENKVVDFNQIIHDGDFSTQSNYWRAYNSSYATLTISNNAVLTTITDSTTSGYNYGVRYGSDFVFPSSCKYYFSINILSNTTGCNLGLDNFGNTTSLTLGKNNFVFTNNYNNQNTLLIRLQGNATPVINSSYSFDNCFVVNLTQMFGSGNEPSAEQFNEWYDSEYYSFTLSKKELLKGYSTITYNDTDIMSQFTYNLYNTVDKYFNMNNVFGMTGIYDWFNLNIFNGKAPLYVYIVWNIILYEFIMDLLFLLYALFMFFIDVCQDLIERCFKSGKGD